MINFIYVKYQLRTFLLILYCFIATTLLSQEKTQHVQSCQFRLLMANQPKSFHQFRLDSIQVATDENCVYSSISLNKFHFKIIDDEGNQIFESVENGNTFSEYSRSEIRRLKNNMENQDRYKISFMVDSIELNDETIPYRLQISYLFDNRMLIP